MKAWAERATMAEVSGSHARYLREMNCQVVHASLHTRQGWTEEYVLRLGERSVGHGSIAVGGPWAGTRTVFQFFVEAGVRADAFPLFDTWVESAKATHVLAQTNDPLLRPMLGLRMRDVGIEKRLFADGGATDLPSHGAVFRRVSASEVGAVFAHQLEPVGEFVLEVDGAIAATGGVLYHYNPPYGDVFMEVDSRFRRRGFGAFLVQELKRVCRESGKVPCARCDVENDASRRTCERAGFVQVGEIVSGRLR
jgi:GNAT superfamily N-acetyltransferase